MTEITVRQGKAMGCMLRAEMCGTVGLSLTSLVEYVSLKNWSCRSAKRQPLKAQGCRVLLDGGMKSWRARFLSIYWLRDLRQVQCLLLFSGVCVSMVRVK